MSLETWILVTVIVVVALAWRRLRRRPPAVPAHDWGGDGLTTLHGPADTIRERVGRGPALTQAVLLAVEMAHADGLVTEHETAAMRSFILGYVTGADEAFAERVLTAGLARRPDDVAVREAIETIRAVSSEEQCRLVLQFLVHVARADGEVHEGEAAFVHRVGTSLGVDAAEVEALVSPRLRAG